VLLALAWPLGLIFCAVWLVIALSQKISSLAALSAPPPYRSSPTPSPVRLWLAGPFALLGAAVHLPATAPTSARLMSGTEPASAGKSSNGNAGVVRPGRRAADRRPASPGSA
jgi:glycerol-3-phosphate acyltransferase PlsY